MDNKVLPTLQRTETGNQEIRLVDYPRYLGSPP